jgi:hypothetical protein
MIEKRSSPARDERGIHLVFKLTSAVPNGTQQKRAHVYPAPKVSGLGYLQFLSPYVGTLTQHRMFGAF